MKRNTARWNFRIESGLVVLLSLIAAGCGGDGPTTSGNKPPDVRGLVAVPAVIPRAGQAQITTLASDDDNDPLTYTWSATAGAFSNASGPRVRWTAPDAAGTYTIRGVASDGRAADSAEVDVHVGSASISVTSTPPGADIYFNGSPTGFKTPAQINGLAATAYNVQVQSPHFVYIPADTAVFLTDGAMAEVTFRIPRAVLEEVDTGPLTVDEIGGLCYSAGGIGVLYAARVGGTTSVRSASLVPTHSGINGRSITPDVHVEESISLRVLPFRSSELAFVFNNSVFIGSLVDNDVDGLIESMPDPVRVRGIIGESYAPAFSLDGNVLALSASPSTQPNTTDVMLAGSYDTLTVSTPVRVTGRFGNSPFFGPERRLVFESGGEIYETEVDSAGLGPATKLSDTGGHAIAPALSPNGRYIAFIDDRGSLEILIPEIGVTTTLTTGVTSQRVAWAPNSRELLISDNSVPGDARLFLVFSLPVH